MFDLNTGITKSKNNSSKIPIANSEYKLNMIELLYENSQ